MRLMDRVVVYMGKHKGKTGTVLDFDSSRGLMIIGFDDGYKGKIPKGELLEINDLELLEFEVGQNLYLSKYEKIGKIAFIDHDEYTVKLEDESIIKTSLDEETDFILA